MKFLILLSVVFITSCKQDSFYNEDNTNPIDTSIISKLLKPEKDSSPIVYDNIPDCVVTFPSPPKSFKKIKFHLAGEEVLQVLALWKQSYFINAACVEQLNEYFNPSKRFSGLIQNEVEEDFMIRRSKTIDSFPAHISYTFDTDNHLNFSFAVDSSRVKEFEDILISNKVKNYLVSN